MSGSQKKRSRDDEADTAALHAVLFTGELLVFIMSKMPLIDRRSFSMTCKWFYTMSNLRFESLKLMRFLHANKQYIKPKEIHTIIAKSGILECVRYIWEKEHFPKTPGNCVEPHFLIPAAESGSREVLLFVISTMHHRFVGGGLVIERV